MIMRQHNACRYGVQLESRWSRVPSRIENKAVVDHAGVLRLRWRGGAVVEGVVADGETFVTFRQGERNKSAPP